MDIIKSGVANICLLDSHWDRLEIRNGLISVAFDFALEYSTKEVQVVQKGLSFSGIYQLLVYVDKVNLLEKIEIP